ncbi:hypothetical protein ACRAWG_00585 [Methylobacterium sp. P31]
MSLAAARGGSHELSTALWRNAAAFAGAAWMSALVNVLTLTSSLFMPEAYGRVISSRSVLTLTGLCVLALVLYVGQSALAVLRARTLARIGAAVDADISPRAFGHSVSAPLRGAKPEKEGQPQNRLLPYGYGQF